MSELARLAKVIAGLSCPTYGLGVDAIVEHVAARADREDEAFTAAQLADLVLALGALSRVPSAIADLETRLSREVASVVRDGGAADVGQEVLLLLLEGGPDGVPKLHQYAGHAPLGVWLRVIVARHAVRARARDERLVPTESSVLEASLVTSGDPELEHLKAAHREAFKRCFAAALGRLSLHDRLLLRQHVIDGLGIDELGRVHGVHRATAARWLARARETLLAKTAAGLHAELGIAPGELAELLREIRSHLDLSLSRLLAAE